MKNLNCNISELRKMSDRERRNIVRRRQLLYAIKHPLKNLGNVFDMFDAWLMRTTKPMKDFINKIKSSKTYTRIVETITLIGLVLAIILMGYAVLFYMMIPMFVLAIACVIVGCH